jgi:GntR family transcriptional repressor for pyruvate dehydrogenase complex
MSTAALPRTRRTRVAFDRIQQPRAHEYVAEQLRRHIALRLVVPGEALPAERELAAMFGVGRPTVQHALRLLERERLVEARRGRLGGTFVLEPADDERVMEELVSRVLRRRHELEELLDYRRMLEPVVVRRAAERRRKADVARMRRLIEGMRGSVPEADYMRFDTEFHIAVAAATQNRYFERATEQIRVGLNEPLSLLPESELWHRRLSGEHETIFQAIEAGDGAAAEAAAELHVAWSDTSVRALLAAIGRRRRRGSRG